METIRQMVEKERVGMLYDGVPGVIILTFAAMSAYAAMLWGDVPHPLLLGWLGVLGLVLALRYLSYLRFRRNTENSALWLRIYRGGALITGMVLGSSALIMFDDLSVAHQLFAVFVLSGVCAGAMVVLAPDHISFSYYVSATLLPTGWSLIIREDTLTRSVGLLVFLYLTTLLVFGRRISNRLIQFLHLGHENTALLEQVAKEKNRLESRLGRLFDDDRHEIFVYNADTLRCIQANWGAVRHLGYEAEEELLGKHLLDILHGLEPEEVEDLLQPLKSGTEDAVIYRGEHRRRDGSKYPVEIRFQRSTRENPPVVVATARDLTAEDAAKNRLFYKANYDPVTDLPNRMYITTLAKRALTRAARHQRLAALLLIDLDNFKQINDTLGHSLGDLLLVRVARRLQDTLGDNATPSRIGGDEFLILIEDIEEPEQAERDAQRLLEAFVPPFRIGEHELHVTLSMGLALFPEDARQLDRLLLYADMAMYRAKQRGRNRLERFHESLLRDRERRLKMERALRRAVDNGELTLLYQPKVDAVSGRVVGAEALLRWHHPEFGTVPPDEFIPMAESMGLIAPLGRWVLETACREAALWPCREGCGRRIAVNVSPAQFIGGRLLDDVEHALSVSDLPVERLELEITETLFVQDTSHLHRCLEQLRSRHIHLSLDDFGTGYSALAYLQRFPLHTLKIDRCFVGRMTESENSRRLVEAIVSMARALNLELVAEGVETARQLEMLQRMGVNIIQGYYFSRPLEARAFRDLLFREMAQTTGGTPALRKRTAAR